VVDPGGAGMHPSSAENARLMVEGRGGGNELNIK